MFPLVLCQNNKRVCHLKTLSNHKNKLWWPPQPWLIIPWQKWWWVAYVTCRKFSKSVILRDQVICGWRSLLTGEQEERGREREREHKFRWTSHVQLKVVSPVEELNARTAPQPENSNQTGRFNSHLNCS